MGLFSLKKTVFYPGTTLSKYFPDLVLNWKSILSDFGIQYDVKEDLNPGWALWDQGYHQEFEEHRAKLRERMKKERIKTVITASPEAVYMFKRFYPEVEAKHTTQVVHENLPKVQRFNHGECVFHDNTTQVRRNGLIKQARDILNAAGFDLKEFDECKERTQCLGTSTGLINNSPRLAAKLALRRVRMAPATLIITDSPEDYLHLRRSTSGQIMELSEVLVEI